MDTAPEQSQSISNFFSKSFLRLALVAFAFITPFAIHNLTEERFLVGTVCCVILAIFAFNAW